ncbi:MAG: poly(R)-hydroxyalkanoic acid synthase subunit PhaE [Gammaproteobacteria bacterium]
MVNALMRVKGQMRTMVDDVLGALNMPTRREMNTVLKRQHELKRELRNLVHGGNGSSTPPRGKRDTSDRQQRDGCAAQ